MHSLKNTFIAVLLLGVSYGVYELITAPDPSMVVDQNLIGPLVVSDGNSDFESEPQPHTELPESVAPLTSQEADSSKNIGALIPTQPPTVGSHPRQPHSNSNSDSIVSRQPKMSFSDEKDIGNQHASAELDSNSQKPHDHELIEALKQHLGSDETEMETESFDPEPKGEMTSVPVRPTQPEKSTAITPDAGDLSINAEPFRQSQPENRDAMPESNSIAGVWEAVEQLAAQQKFRKALGTLTRYYNDATLTSDQNQKLLSWLDALAGKVIYSAEHHLASQPYVVQPNESLLDIANNWNVSAQLVYNVNRNLISDPSNLTAGEEIKVISGPFHAEVDITKKVLTVFVDDLYAGRFPVDVSPDANIQAGRYGVIAKSADPKSKGSNQSLAADGHGPHWIGLEGGLCLHAVTERVGSQHQQCIGLSPKDAADLFSIFTEKSQIFVKR